MRRVALISEHASPLAMLGGVDSGGQNVYVGQLAQLLSRRGYDVDVFTRRDRADLPLVAPFQGARVIHVPAGPAERVEKEKLLPHMDEFTRFVLRFAERQNRDYDIVHANFFMSAQVAMSVKRALGIPFVVTFHALGRVRRKYQRDADTFPDARLEIEERAIAAADRVIAECPQDREDLIQLYGAQRARLRTIPCGFDPLEFAPRPRPQARRTLGLDPHEPIILQLGRMVPRKGVDNVIRGLARLRRVHGVAARLLIVGGESRAPDPSLTPEIGRLQRLAHEENVAPAVTFVGSRGRSELRDYYCAADVFVTTPWYEPFGITPIEAMACGTPVIGAAVGGIKSTVRDGETGFLVPPSDPDALAERLAALFDDATLRARLGHNAVRRAQNQFTWQSVAGKISSLYEEILATAPSPHLATAVAQV